MLKMRAYMSMNNWTEAVKAGKLVTGYELTPKFGDMFKLLIIRMKPYSLCR